jgi:OTU domain-containing protein 5
MTILPKKKQTKEKNETEVAEPAAIANPNHGHGFSVSENPNRVSRRAIPSNAPASHDPGGSGTKRRHRSSPHRLNRKHSHRHERERPTCSSPPLSPTQTSSSQQLDEEDDMQTGYNSEDEYVPPKHPENLEELERWFEKTLKDKRGFSIKQMGQDGACLFRSVADQVFGDEEMHSAVRQNCVEYMKKNVDFFSQYVTEDFNAYLLRKQQADCHGNHVEIQALSELYNRAIEVYQYSIEPINTFHGAYKTDNDPIRVSYHRNEHYNSLVDPYKATIGVGLGLPGYQPGLADKNLMTDAIKKSEEFHLEKAMLEDKLRETDWELTQESIEEQVARESYLQWLRDNEKRAKRQTSPRSASATCSSASDSQNWWEMTTSTPPEPRASRSPRNRSNPASGQNSPNRPDQVDLIPMSSALSPTQPGPSHAVARCHTPEGATGGAQAFPTETSSLMNSMPPHVYGLSEWDEDDIIAQVIAQSQQEYLDSLKRAASPSSSSASTSTATATCTASTSAATSSDANTPMDS